MKVWSMVSEGGVPSWQFESINGLCTLMVDANYTSSDYYYNAVLSFFGDRIIGNYLGEYFQIIISCRLLRNGFTILHAACVEKDGVALAFSGPSGIGKSTRASKWVDLFGANWVSGDRPAINASKGVAYGVPWDGKERVFRNTQHPLAVVIKVSRSKTPYIRPMTHGESMRYLCGQSFLPLWDPKLAARAMHSIKKLIDNVPLVELGCDITDESVCKAHELLHGAIELER